MGIDWALMRRAEPRMGGLIMGLRYRRRASFGKLIHVNFSKSGASLSLGVPGATMNIGRRGIRQTVGLPGTGRSYSQQVAKWGGWRQAPPAQLKEIEETEPAARESREQLEQ